jgi:hypothetical protein
MKAAIYSIRGRRIAAVTKGVEFTPRESFTEPGVLVAHTMDADGRSVTVRIYPDDWDKMVDFIRYTGLSDRYNTGKE